MLVAGLIGVLVVLSGAALLVAGFAVAYHRARAAADLAALSGATVFARGADACQQARRSARDNGASARDCEQVGDQIDFVVTVRVAVPVRMRVPGLPDHVEAVAHAGSVQ